MVYMRSCLKHLRFRILPRLDKQSVIEEIRMAVLIECVVGLVVMHSINNKIPFGKSLVAIDI